MGYTLDFTSTHVDLKSMQPGEYVRFNTSSHGPVIMVALKEELHGRSEDQAVFRFLLVSERMVVIDAAPAEIRTGGAFSIAEGRVIEITDPIHINC